MGARFPSTGGGIGASDAVAVPRAAIQGVVTPLITALSRSTKRYWPASELISNSGNSPLSWTTHAVTPSDGFFNTFPWVAAGKDGRLYATCREGGSHTTIDGKVVLQTSSDGGLNWSAKVYLAAPPAGHDYRDPSIATTNTGRLIVNFFDWNGGATLGVYVIYSDDNGATWSSPNHLTPFTSVSGGQGATTGAVLQHRSGTLIMPVYGQNTGDTYDRCGVLLSTDDGVTWSPVIAISATNSRMSEVSLVEMANGDVQAFIRLDPGDPSFIYMSKSTDVGVAWTAPAALTVSGYPARPAAIVLPDNDTIVLTYAQHLTAYPCYRYSVDRGATWSAEYVLISTIGQYCGGVAISGNNVGIVFAKSNSTTSADVQFVVLEFGRQLPSTLIHAVSQLGVDVTFGKQAFTGNGTAGPITVDVTHGLGKTPVAWFGTPGPPTGWLGVVGETGTGPVSTLFHAQCSRTDAATFANATTYYFYWVAIG